MAGKFGGAIRAVGSTLQEDAKLKATINQFARRAVVRAVAAYGSGIVTLVSDTIRGWDARTVTARLENAVGRDLHYIRITGTPDVGLVGLVLHLSELLGRWASSPVLFTSVPPCPRLPLPVSSFFFLRFLLFA